MKEACIKDNEHVNFYIQTENMYEVQVKREPCCLVAHVQIFRIENQRGSHTWHEAFIYILCLFASIGVGSTSAYVHASTHRAEKRSSNYSRTAKESQRHQQ